MLRQQRRLLLLLACGVAFLPSLAQEDVTVDVPVGGNVDEQSMLDVAVRILQYRDEIGEIQAAFLVPLDIDGEHMDLDDTETMASHIKQRELQLNAFASRWATYSQAQQALIAESDSMLLYVADIQQCEQDVRDSIVVRRQQIEMLSSFCKAEKVLFSKDAVYKKYYQRAMALSLIPKGAPLLEKVKASEQIDATELQQAYSTVMAAAAAFPALDGRMKKIDSKYVKLQSVSAAIQEAAYKPLIQRLKDYLIGIAAVAIVLMFLTMVVSKLQAISKAREAAKKMREMMGSANDDLPTI